MQTTRPPGPATSPPEHPGPQRAVGVSPRPRQRGVRAPSAWSLFGRKDNPTQRDRSLTPLPSDCSAAGGKGPGSPTHPDLGMAPRWHGCPPACFQPAGSAASGSERWTPVVFGRRAQVGLCPSPACVSLDSTALRENRARTPGLVTGSRKPSTASLLAISQQFASIRQRSCKDPSVVPNCSRCPAKVVNVDGDYRDLAYPNGLLLEQLMGDLRNAGTAP